MYTSTAAQEKQDYLQKFVCKKKYKKVVLPWMRKHISDTAYQAYEYCGEYLSMLEDAPREKKKLELGYFCKQRFCPCCAWRAAVRDAECVAAISQALAAKKRVMLMVTLTIPNVEGEYLQAAIKQLYVAWHNLMKRKKYKAWADHIRKLEVTYNDKRGDYHPHLHIIIYVKPSYFKGKAYIKQEQLLEDWREVTHNNNITQVHVERCYSKDNTNAILEVAKYSAKPSDYTHSEKVFDTMYNALHRTRLITYAGACKKLRVDYKAGKLDKFKETDETEYVWRVIYKWQRETEKYVEHDVQKYDAKAEAEKRVQKQENKRIEAAIECGQAVDWMILTHNYPGWVASRGAVKWEYLT